MSPKRGMPTFLMELYDRLLRQYGPQGWWPGDGPFETIVGAILTQNTTWTNVDRALTSLRSADALSPGALRRIPEAELAQLIRSSGYFNAKARKLKAMAEWLAGYGDDLVWLRTHGTKDLRAELLAVHGIGPETADDIVLYAAGLPSFVIDSYTRRVMERLRTVPERDTYDGYKALFEENLPSEAPLFNEFHALLDAHAKQTCRKRDPRCEDCCLLDLCPTGQSALDARHPPRSPTG